MKSENKVKAVGAAIHYLVEPFAARHVAMETGIPARACSTILNEFDDVLDREEVSRSHGYRYQYRLKATVAKKKTRKGIRDVIMQLTQENLDELLRIASEMYANQIVPWREG